MRKILLIILLIVAVLSGKAESDTNSSFETGIFFPKVTSRSMIMGNITNINDIKDAPRTISISINDITINSYHVFETKVDEDGNFKFDIPLRNPINIKLKYGISPIPLYLFPNDTLSYNCEITKRGTKIGFISGNFDKKHNKFQNDFMTNFFWLTKRQLIPFYDQISKTESPQIIKEKYLAFKDELLEKIETLTKIESLDKVTSDFLRNYTIYDIYDNILNRALSCDTKQEAKEYLSFLNDSVVYNEKALHTNNYQYFLNKYRSFKDKFGDADTTVSSKSRTDESENVTETSWIIKDLQSYKGLWGEILAGFHLHEYNIRPEEASLANIKYYMDIIEKRFTDKYTKQLLLSYCDDALKTITKLETQKIPSKTTLDKYASLSGEELLNKILSERKGKTILIDMWATWCGPCKAAFPHTLELQAAFPDVEFVYLCTNSREENWDRVIRQYQLSGTNILLNDEQTQYIKERFSIPRTSHYLLIDKNGDVALNHQPGSNTMEVLETKLKEITKK